VGSLSGEERVSQRVSFVNRRIAGKTPDLQLEIGSHGEPGMCLIPDGEKSLQGTGKKEGNNGKDDSRATLIGKDLPKEGKGQKVSFMKGGGSPHKLC